MSEHDHDPEQVERRAHAVRLALAVNVATNGRWFCALLALVNATAGHPVLAAVAALPIGLSVLSEQAPEDGPVLYARIAIYALTAFAFFSTLAVNW